MYSLTEDLVTQHLESVNLDKLHSVKANIGDSNGSNFRMFSLIYSLPAGTVRTLFNKFIPIADDSEDKLSLLDKYIKEYIIPYLFGRDKTLREVYRCLSDMCYTVVDLHIYNFRYDRQRDLIFLILRGKVRHQFEANLVVEINNNIR